MQTAVIYARYSSESQTEQSIEGQLRVCQKYAKEHDYLILDTYIDRAMTGTNDIRPAFQKMIHDSAKRQWKAVIVYKLDRFSRNKYESTIHKKTLNDNGVSLVSAMENIPDTPEGVILESLLEGMNAYFSAELSQKVKRGLLESWTKGLFTGGTVPYGYRVENRRYVLDEKEAPIVLEVFEKYAKGRTAVDIAKELKEKGYRNRKGNSYLDTSFIYRIIGNIKYTGKVEYRGVVYENIIPAIVSEEIWKEVQKIREGNRHSPGRKKEIYDFLLSGKLVCGDCKRLMVGESGTSHTGDKHYYYSCLSRRRRKQPCQTKSIGKQYLEDIVIDATVKMLSEGDTLHTIAILLCELHKEQCSNNTILNDLEAKLTTAQRAANNLISAIEQGIITEQTKNRLKELEAQINGLEFDIEREKQRTYTYLQPDEIEEYLKAILELDIHTISARKTLVKTFIREVIFYPNKIIITYNFTDTYDIHEITPELIDTIEKTANNKKSSYKLSSSAPVRT